MRRTFNPSGSIGIGRPRAELVAKGLAYYCYCTPEELKAKREAAERDTGGWVYDRTCASLEPEEIASREARAACRAPFDSVVPAGATTFDDLVHGPIAFDGANIEDFVILRSDGHPTYHLSVGGRRCRDADHACGSGRRSHFEHAEAGAAVSRAWRGVPRVRARAAHSRSRQEALEQASRRDVGDGVRAQGYLPEAMVNFLALLGWSPGDAHRDRELFTREELVAGSSRSTASAAATPSSIPKSSTGSISSTSSASRPGSSRAGFGRHLKRRVCGMTPILARGTRGFLRCSSC